MKKFFKILLSLFLVASSISVAAAGFIVRTNKVSQSAEIIKDTVTKDCCYNKQTNKKYYDLKVALDQASDNQTIYTIPGSTINVTETLTIRPKITLIMPYLSTLNETNGTYSDEKYNIAGDDEIGSLPVEISDSSANGVKNNRRCLLNLRNGADINIEGKLIVGSEYRHNGVSGKYCEINLGEQSMITCNGTFECYGYVKEDSATAKNSNQEQYLNTINNECDPGRSIVVNSGGKLTSVVAIFDLQSGSILTKMDENKVCPFNDFIFPTLQTYIELNSGCFYYVSIHCTISGNSLSKTLEAASSSNSALYKLTSGKMSMEYCPVNPLYTSISDNFKIYINGTVDQGYLAISIAGIGVDTSKYFIPINYKYEIVVGTQGNFSTQYAIKFLPGSKLLVLPGGVINANAPIVGYLDDTINLPSFKDVRYLNIMRNKGDSIIINNGIINVSGTGALGGEISTTMTDGSAKIIFDANAKTTVQSPETITGMNVNVSCFGDFVDSSTELGYKTCKFVSGSTITSDSGGSMKWSGSAQDVIKLHIKCDNEMNYPIPYSIYRVFEGNNNTGASKVEVSSDLMRDSYTFLISKGKYLSVEIYDCITAEFKVYPNTSTSSFASHSWYQANQNCEILIKQTEGVNIDFTVNARQGETQSGRGGTTITLSVADEEGAATYMNLPVFSIEVHTQLRKNKWFKFDYTIGLGSAFYNVFVKREVKKGPANLVGTNLNSKQAYQASESMLVECILGKKGDSDYIEDTGQGGGGGCLAKGAMVLMSDFSLKAIENVTINDYVMSINHYTGELEPRPVLAIFNHGILPERKVNLKFDNGDELIIIGNHDLYNYTKRNYVAMYGNNAHTFIGDEFISVNENGVISKTKLIAVEDDWNDLMTYDIVSDTNLNIITDNILNSIPFTNNYFEFNDDLTYNKEMMKIDIDRYGLYSYEELEDYIWYDVFVGGNLKYFKISVGKGYFDENYIYNVCNIYQYLIQTGVLQVNFGLHNRPLK